MKCKVLSTTIVYADEYFKPGAIFDAKDEDVKGLVEGGFVEAIEAPKEEPKAEEKPAESKKSETVEEAPKEEPKAEEKPAEKPEAKGGKKK